LRKLDFKQLIQGLFKVSSLFCEPGSTLALQSLFLFLKLCIIKLKNHPVYRNKLVQAAEGNV
jgi:succinate-acetate transporter protein